MSKTDSETVKFLRELTEYTDGLDRELVQPFVIPSFTVLSQAAEVLSGSGILLGAQNMGPEDRGQFTGEVSPLSLKELGVSIVEIGHSERRHIFHESCEDTRQKVCKALEHGFIPLLCVGETAEEKERGIAREILSIQLKVAFGGLEHEAAKRCMVAYEPVWAIGVNGTPASPLYAGEQHRFIKSVLGDLFGTEIGESIPVLYGGSVNAQNAEALISQPGIDGLFVGRAAWNAKEYRALIDKVLPVFAQCKG